MYNDKEAALPSPVSASHTLLSNYRLQRMRVIRAVKMKYEWCIILHIYIYFVIESWMPCALWSTPGSPQGCMLGPLLLTPYWFAVLLSPNTATNCLRCQHSSHAKVIVELGLQWNLFTNSSLFLLLLRFSACLSCWYQQPDRLLSQTAYRLSTDSHCWSHGVIITLLITGFIYEEDNPQHTGTTEVLPCLFVFPAKINVFIWWNVTTPTGKLMNTEKQIVSHV